ncbi:MAG: flavin reductase family protein [Campylobacterales bacterium]|nr:flavin reductase family protein [Campylobacterales bacterium]
MKIDFNQLDPHEIYKLMSTHIIPRPIAWVITENDEGIKNLAPFSYFAPLSSTPPCVMISVGHKDDGMPKDTLYNIRTHKKCTICMVTEEFYKKMHMTSKSLPRNESEAKEFDIELDRKFEDFPPMVADIDTAFFCEFMQEIDLEDSSTRPLVLKVKHAFIHKKSESLPICRIGKSYAKIGQELEVPKID